MLLTVGITSLVLITTWGGTEYDWLSSQIIGLGAVGVVALLAFVLVETKVREPSCRCTSSATATSASSR